MRNGHIPHQASAPTAHWPSPEIESFDSEKEIARDERIQKLAYIAKELERLEMVLWRRKGKFYVQSVPGTLTQELHGLLKECRTDLLEMALFDPTDSPITIGASSLPTTDQRNQQGWSEALQFTHEWGTAWLFPYRALIEGARQGLLPPGPVVPAEGAVGDAEGAVDDPALAVIQAAQAIAGIALATRGRAVPRELKAPLLKHFEVLRLIEEWRCSIECYP